MRKFIFITLGTLISAIGLHFFLVSTGLAVGGVAGLAMQIQFFFPSLNIGIISLVSNIILYIMAFIFIGRYFAGYTIYSSLLLSFFLGFFEKYFSYGDLLHGDTLLNLVTGVFLLGLGIAITLLNGASGGGLDILAKIMTKYTGYKISYTIFFFNFLVTIGACYVYGLKNGIYALFGVFLNSIVIDKVISGISNKKHIMIISDYHVEVVDFIHRGLDRGATYIKGEGTYKNQPKNIVSVVLDRENYIKLMKKLSEIDQTALVIVTDAYDVVGPGFTGEKVYISKEETS